MLGNNLNDHSIHRDIPYKQIVTIEVSVIFKSFPMICKFTVHGNFPIPLTAKSLVQYKFEALPFSSKFAVKGMGNLPLTGQLANYR